MQTDAQAHACAQGALAEQGIERLQSDTDVQLVPSAPPIHISLSSVRDGHGDLLSLEPPSWLPDSHAPACGHCKAPFQ